MVRVAVRLLPRSLRLSFALTLLVASVGFATATAHSQTAVAGSTWTQLSPATSPPAREQAAFGYDAAHGTLVMFGGYSGSAVLSETWTWNGTTWTQMSPTTVPAARYDARLVFDTVNNKLLMYGGVNGAPKDETWEWDGANWTQLSPATTPGQRGQPAMSADVNGHIVLFGGSYGGILNDTWIWNGTTWAKQTPATSPPGRYQASFSYDAATGTTVLFGGFLDTMDTAAGDTWTWDGANWTQKSPATSPSARAGSGIAYSAGTGTVVLFGGFNLTTTYLGDTWEWNGTNWNQRTLPKSPSARYVAQMAFDPSSGSVVLFGGNSGAYQADTWNYSTGAFTAPTTNVGTAAAQTPVYFTIATAGTLGTLSNATVLTLGAPGLDFTLGTGSTCTGAVTAGSTCIVNVAFTPKAPGQRLGAVNLTDSNNNVIATAYISGMGTGPLATLTPGQISTLIGTGLTCTQPTASPACGDTGAATAATISFPYGVAVDGAGNLFIADQSDNRIRKVTTSTGIVTTVAGNGTNSSSGDGGQATAAAIGVPAGVALDGAGNLYIGTNGPTIRMVAAATGVIRTIAGGGASPGTCSGSTDAVGDGCAATSATLNEGLGLAVDGAGNLFIADRGNGRIREVSAATGTITTVAGTGTNGYIATQDTGTTAATAAELNGPTNVALDAARNLYIADTINTRIRKVSAATGYISTVAGNGSFGYTASQDTGTTAATAASLATPLGLTVDAGGNLYVADYGNNRVRKVTAATGYISTVAGSGSTTYAAAQDTGTTSSTAATVYTPTAVALDNAGNLYVVDQGDLRVRKVSVKSGIVFPTATAAGTADSTDGTQTALLNNIGNLPLTISAQTEKGAGFALGNPNTGGCSNSVAVSAGGSCLLGATFAPVAGQTGVVIGGVAIKDNSLNVTTTQNVPLLGTTTLGAVNIETVSTTVPKGTATTTLEFLLTFTGTAGDTGAFTATVNGSATGVGAITCTGKPGHQNCTFPYTGTALATAAVYPISVSVASDSNYSAGSGSGTLTVTCTSGCSGAKPVQRLPTTSSKGMVIAK